MNSFKIGLCSVTFRKKSAAQVVLIAKKAGVEYIEWGGDVHVTNAEEARIVKSICDNEGIKISSYGSYFNSTDFDKEEWEQVCKIAKIMDAASIRIWLGRKNSEEVSDREYRALLENTKKMCDIAAQYGLAVCPECHDNTFNNNTDAFLRLKKELNKDNFGTYFQSRYFRMEYDLDRIDRTFDYIKDVHVSYRDLKKEQRHRKKDKYYLDTLLKKLKARDFDGIVMVEFVDFNSEIAFYRDVRKLKSY